jgi:uncharacterized OB-fold protein
MDLSDGLKNVFQTKAWKDTLPLNYKYSAGVAGQRFAEGLKQGRIIGSKCGKCGQIFVPPSLYCHACYVYTTEYVEVPPYGEIYSFTESGGVIVALIRFKGVTGGLIHYIRRPGAGKLKIGLSVAAVFKPQESRRGDITDIEYFEVRARDDR